MLRAPSNSFFYLVLTFCAATPGCVGDRAGDRLERAGDEIVAAGQFFHTGTPVVLWLDPGGYDAYRAHRRFEPDTAPPLRNPRRLARYGTFRGGLPAAIDERVRRDGWTFEDLRATVRQVVLHFDASGTSRRCFEVLHDIRGLSCHFLLDLDGTVYQTLDVKERAWHAAQANNHSVGVEIANIGAVSDIEALSAWYARDDSGVRITLPEGVSAGGLPADFVGRPRRDEPVRGTINGKSLVQYDFTEEQYVALENLLITLCRVFPRIKAAVPRAPDGAVLDRAFSSEDELLGFEGLLGHHHVTTEKVDPGPAFDWERILGTLRDAGIATR